MFPVAPVVLAGAVLRVPAARRWAASLALALVSFGVVAGPWVLCLHARYGRWTFGDSATFDYAWLVDGAPRFIHWRGGPPGTGVPVHPEAEIFGQPEAFAYAEPIPGTFPLWDDPSYWNTGLRPYFNLRRQTQVLRAGLRAYARLATRPLAAVVVGFLFLAFLTGRAGALRSLFSTGWPVWLVGAAGLAMFALIEVQSRYVGGFLALLWGGLLAGVRVRGSRRVVLLVALAMALSLDALVALAAATDLRGRFPGATNPQWQVVQELERAGLGAGDRVAILGQEMLWAPISGMRIIADIPESQTTIFWRMNDKRRTALLRRLAASGARAIIAGPHALAGQASSSAQARTGWQPLGRTGYQVCPLQR